MSAHVNHYVILGVNVPYSWFSERRDDDEASLDAYLDSRHHSKINEKGGVSIVADYMSGDYCVVGRIIAKSGDYEGLPFVELGWADAERPKFEIMAQINAQFLDLVNNVDDIKVYAFGHYS